MEHAGIQVGSKVEYMSFEKGGIKSGTVTSIMRVIDDRNKGDINKIICFVSYSSECYPDIKEISELKIID